jgi:putative Mg2+ transporter-C (MgtC) family protein
MVDYGEIILRLGLATLVGGAVGLNRDLHGKPTGIRTLGLVGLGSALAMMASLDLGAGNPTGDLNASSRVIQGVLAGIGFLGAGVIVRNRLSHVQGLTTAACIWLTAAIGVLCGLGAWRPIIVAMPLVFIILVGGGPLEKALRHRFGEPDEDSPP